MPGGCYGSSFQPLTDLESRENFHVELPVHALLSGRK